MQKIVFLDRNSLKAKLREPQFECEYKEYAQTSEAEVIARLQGVRIAITNKVPLRESTLAQLPDLKLIAIAATGYDCVDIPACRTRGINVCNIRNYAVHTVPEHAFALILALRRNLFAYQQDVQSGQWQASEQFCFITHEIGDLHGATLGIIGEGALGMATAAIAKGFGMNVLFAEHGSSQHPDVAYTSLDKLLAISDIVSLHCPLTPATRHMIGIEQLKAMKRSALLINTSRGGLVDEAALAVALKKGLIAGAGFDVLTTEPPKLGNPLLELRLSNFILTPHIAWASAGAMQSLADQLIDNIEAWQIGKPQHLVA